MMNYNRYNLNLNTIYTDEEYMAQGFTKEEVPMIRKHDELFNKYQLEFGPNNWDLTDEQWDEFEELQKALDL